MAKYFTLDLVPQGGGLLGSPVSVSVVSNGTTSAIPIYEDEALTIPLINPFPITTTNLHFWVANGSLSYDVLLSGGNLLSPVTISNIWSLPGPVWADVSTFWEDRASEWAYIYPYTVAVASRSEDAMWTPDIAEIIEEAYERCGVEIRTGYQFRTARRSLNLLFQEWANRGLNLWTIEQGEIPLNVGQISYALPDDTVDLIEHVIRQNQGSQYNQVDLQISRIAVPTYATIPNKLAQGRPIQLYVDRQSPTPVVKVWPTANATGYTLVYWRLRRIKDAMKPGYGQMDIPFRFMPALIAGLAYYLSLKEISATNRTQMLKQMYDEAFDMASREDRDRSPVRFVPRIVGIGSGGW